MMRSMFSALSGLRVHQTKMDVIANNISNVNTVGFKSSRVVFSEVFPQTLSGASQADELTGRGGVNPKQIGLGVSLASIDLNMIGGAPQRTDRSLDMSISGDGFFIVADNSGTYFTRAGAMDLDKAGYLVGAGGLRVQGWTQISEDKKGKQTVEKGKVEDIFIGPDKQYVAPTTTKNIGFEGNLHSDVDGAVKSSTMSFYDSKGNRYTANVTYTYDKTADVWNCNIDPKCILNGDNSNIVDLKFTGSETLDFAIKFDANGKVSEVGAVTKAVPPDTQDLFELTVPNTTAPDAPEASFGEGGKIEIDFWGLTSFASDKKAVKGIEYNGNSSGNLKDISIGTDGTIFGLYSNGQQKILAQIAVANFKNPAGLQKIGNNLFIPTANSGDFDGVGEIVTALGAEMQGGTLEMSNVDLSSEFTEMITTQRGFQANSRIITTSDEMLQELVNLKR